MKKIIILFLGIILLSSCTQKLNSVPFDINSNGTEGVVITKVVITEQSVETSTIEEFDVEEIDEVVTNINSFTPIIVEHPYYDDEHFNNIEFLNIIKDLAHNLTFEMPSIGIYTVLSFAYLDQFSIWFYQSIMDKVIDSDIIYEWGCSFGRMDDDGTTIVNIVINVLNSSNVYNFVKHFNLTWEDIEDIYVNYNETIVASYEPYYYLYVEPKYLSRAEWDLILNGSAEDVTRYFTVETAIAIGVNIFPGDWIYYKSINDYIENGITPQMLIDKLPIYSETFFNVSELMEYSHIEEIAIMIEHKTNAYNTLKQKFEKYAELEKEAYKYIITNENKFYY